MCVCVYAISCHKILTVASKLMNYTYLMLNAPPTGPLPHFVSARPRSAEYTIRNLRTQPSNTFSLDSGVPYENLAQLETVIL